MTQPTAPNTYDLSQDASHRLTPDVVQKFWERVDRTGGPESCWLWQGGHSNRRPYLFVGKGKYFSVNRIAYSLTKGTIPPGQKVMHTCQNESCINPAHLK